MAIAIFFMYCHMGDGITSKCVRIADIVYTQQWYNYPVEQQRYLVLMVQRAQQPFCFTGLTESIADCSLETFKAVSNPMR